MKRHIFILMFLLSTVVAVGSIRAADIQYWAISTHPCTITDVDGEGLAFNQQNEKAGGYYHIFNDDYGITDLSINESNAYDRIWAKESKSLRFKGWWTKKDGWTGEEAYVSETDTCITVNKMITGAQIKTAGQWGQLDQRRPTIIAKYVPIYTITTSVEPTDVGTATGGGTYEEGEAVKLQASPASGYSFRDWTKSGAVVSSDKSYSFAATADGAYVAVMTGNVYKVTLDQQEGSGGSTTVFVTFGEKASTLITPPARFGWTFGGYYTERNGEGTKVYNADGTPADVWKTAGNLTLYAYWIPDQCDLTIRPPAFGVTEIQYRLGEDKNWVKVTGETTVKVLCGTVCHVYVNEQSGYDLGSPDSPWTTEDGLSGRWKAEMTGNGLVFAPQADWIGYRLTVEPNGGTYRKSTERYTWTERLRPGETNLNSIGTVIGGNAAFLGFFDGRGEPVYDANGENVEGTYWTKPHPDGVFRGTGDLTVYARWGQRELTVSATANDGKMGSAFGGGSFDAGSSVCLEAVANDGYGFLRWEKGGATVSSANPYRFVATAGTAGEYVAIFGKRTYAVGFYGNGGTNEMANQIFESNEVKPLSSNVFERAGFDFAGWLTDPTNAAPTYADGETVSNLNIRLFAAWAPKGATPVETTNYLDNAYSVAADCATNRIVDADGTVAMALELSASEGCTVVTNDPEQCVKLQAANQKKNASLFATIEEDGLLLFGSLIHGDFTSQEYAGFYTNGALAVDFKNGLSGSLTNFECRVGAGTKLEWRLKALGDKDVMVDDIRWIPDTKPTPPGPGEVETVGVTLRLNDGTPAPDDIYTNLTCEVGDKVDLPELEGAGGFTGWSLTPGGEPVEEPWSVPSESVQLFAKWKYEVVAIPTAISGLVYDGNLKTGVVEGVCYSLTGNTATDAGDHSATAALLSKDCVWSDGESAAKKIAWSIGKATYDLSGISMTNATYVYDGQPHSLAISGELPDGVTVTYSTNDCVEVGEYEIKASFAGDEVNHLKIEKQLFATLTILKHDDPPPPPPPPPVQITNAVPVAVTGLVYDGTLKTGVPAGEGYGIVSNVATSAGTYVATAVPDEGHVWPNGLRVPTNIVWTIAKGTPDVSGITFPSATYEYDGNEHSIGIIGTPPPGVKVVYLGDSTNRTEIGTNTVTASFVITDTDNWKEDSLGSLEATLVIAPPPPPPDPSVAYENIYFRATLAELGAEAVPTNRKITIKAEGLPKGLKLVTKALKDERNRATGYYEYSIEGVPTELMDGGSRLAYVRVTDNKVQTLYVLDLSVLWAKAYEEKSFPDGEVKSDYANFSVTNLWPDVAVNPKNWTFSGWPSGIKYATKAVTSRKKIDGAYVTVTNALAYEVYGTPTKAGRFTVKATEKIVGTSYKSTYVATFTIWPEGSGPADEWTDQAYVGVYRKSNENVKSASGLPTGIKFTARDITSRGEVVTEAHRFYGTPTKAGTYAVTLTYEDNSKTQFLWTITPADAPAFELKLLETSVDPLTAKATIRQGVAYEWAITNTLGSKVSASGLPSGLSLKSTAIKDGKTTIGYAYSVKGVPTKAGEYVVTFKTTLNGVTTVTTAAFTVLDLPAWAQGTFDGGADETFQSGGQATLTLSKVGKLSGKWMSLGTNWTLSAASYDRYDKASESYVAQMIGKTGSGKTAALFTNELTVAADGLGGIATNDLFIAYQNNWKLEPWKTVGKAFSKAKELVFVPEGYETNDTVSLKFATSGKVTVKGKFVKSVSDKGKITWYSVSGSAVLCPQTEPGANDAFGGYVFVYLPPKAKTPLEDGGYAVCVPVVWDGMKFDIWKFDEE